MRTIFDKIKELAKEANKAKRIPVYKEHQKELNAQGWYHLSDCARRNSVSRQSVHKAVNHKTNPIPHFYLFNKLWVREYHKVKITPNK